MPQLSEPSLVSARSSEAFGDVPSDREAPPAAMPPTFQALRRIWLPPTWLSCTFFWTSVTFLSAGAILFIREPYEEGDSRLAYNAVAVMSTVLGVLLLVTYIIFCILSLICYYGYEVEQECRVNKKDSATDIPLINGNTSQHLPDV